MTLNDRSSGVASQQVSDGSLAHLDKREYSALWALRRDLPSALLAVLLFAMPLYRTRVLEDSFNTPKLALALVISVVAAVAILARPGALRVPLRLYIAPWLVVALAVWQGASALWADSKPLAVDGTVYFAAFAVLVWLFMRGPSTVAALRGLFNAGTAAAVVTAVWVLADDFAGGEPGIVARLPDWRGNLSAGLGNSGHIAGMVGMFLPWMLLMFLRGDDAQASRGGAWRWLALVGIALSFAALTVTWSVGSSGATILSLLIWAVVAWRVLPRGALRWRRLGWVVGAGLAVVAFFFLPVPLNPHSPSIYKQAFSSERWEEGWPTRVVIWETTWHMIKQEPLVGMGTGNFTYNYTQQVVPSVMADPALRRYAGQFTNDAHNDYLQLWAEGGVVALALWLAALSAFVTQIGKMLRRRGGNTEDAHTSAMGRRCHLVDVRLMLIGAGAGLTVFALDGLMSFPMYLPAHFCMAMFFIAVPGVLLRVAPNPSATRRVASGDTAAAYGHSWRAGGVGVLLTLAACVWHHGHRVVAEYYLKAGRMAAESTVVNTGQGFASPWQTCDMLYRQTVARLASGATIDELQPTLSAMKNLADLPEMKSAGLLFEKSLAADRWYANASSRLGQLRLFQNDWHGAFDVSRRTLKTLETFEIHERMAMAAFFSGDMKKSHEHWVICETRVPHAADLYGALAARTERKP